MLRHVSPRVAECHAQATRSRERALSYHGDPRQAAWLEAERRWLFLAESYELMERVDAFLHAAGRPR